MLLKRVVVAMMMGVVWIFLVGKLGLDSFLIGTLLGFVILTRLGAQFSGWEAMRLPQQVAAGVIYSLTMSRDIFLSSVDVAQRVLNPAMPLKPGIIAVETQLDDDAIAALSAHSITITPGELVVDFDGGKTMYVHCLDVEKSSQSADKAQKSRLGMFRRILGYAPASD